MSQCGIDGPQNGDSIRFRSDCRCSPKTVGFSDRSHERATSLRFEIHVFVTFYVYPLASKPVHPYCYIPNWLYRTNEC